MRAVLLSRRAPRAQQGAQPAAGQTGRRPWWIWAAPWAVLFGVVVVRNRDLFSVRLYEQGDSGADSILIEQARRFTLLIGNYSREGFNHPGPAFLYVKSWGESLLWAGTRLVPTAWNGQIIAGYALSGLFLALVVGVVYGWVRSLPAALAAFAVVTAFAVAYPAILSSGWMPYMYVPAYLAFVVASASVAAGRSADSWIMALSGWFLINGHACFLFFVPAITAVVLLALVRRHGPGGLAGYFGRNWIPVAAISAVLVLPIVVNLILHWPGDFGKYFSYGSSSHAGGHSLAQAARYGLWFWWPHPFAWAVAAAGFALACVLAWRFAVGGERRLAAALLGLTAVSTAAFVCYALIGIDDLTSYYIGYFYWTAPAVTLLAAVISVLRRLPGRAALAVAGAAAAAAVAGLCVVHGTSSSLTDDDPALPHAVSVLASAARGKTLVLRIDHAAWVQTTGFLVQAERSDVRACVEGPWWTFLMSKQFVCTPAQAASGLPVDFLLGPVPGGQRVLIGFDGVSATSG